MREINLIVVHCSATPSYMDIGVDKIREWHTTPSKDDPSKPWSDIGYHYVIKRNGDVEVGRPENQIGAHVAGFNRISLGICLIGGVNADNRKKAEFNFSHNQMLSLYSFLTSLSTRFPNVKICGHRDLNPKKACPCFDVSSWWGSETLVSPE